jgi:hypothetical protein
MKVKVSPRKGDIGDVDFDAHAVVRAAPRAIADGVAVGHLPWRVTPPVRARNRLQQRRLAGR